ncbi:MAG: carboxylesterase family protein [Flavobacteriales bacterium]|nr:carboxylesterase family protein [Flavobacteriales bacterium]
MLGRLLSLLVICTLTLSSIAQCDGTRYRNLIFPEFEVTSDILYGSNINYLGGEQDLYLDVYEPLGDTEVERPLVVVAHGGSFVAGSKTGQDVVPLCQDLARMGYVVASIQYRLGIPIIGDLNTNAKSAVVRGVHDSRAAIRYFRKDVAENGNSFDIDPEKIFMAGVSAGGFNALHVAYMDEESEIPLEIDQSQAGLGGGIEGESGNAGYSSAIAGVVNIAGAIAHPDIMNNNDTPVCSFHGTGDSVVPFDTDVLTFFGIFEVDTVYGSQAVHEQAELLEIENCFFVQFLEGHVPHVDDAQHYDTLRSITSNFLSHLVCPEVELDCNYRQVEVVSDLEEIAMEEPLFQLWPNPATEWIQLGSIDSRELRYSILDVTGTEVMSGIYQDDIPRISVSDLQNGVYLIRLESQKGVRTLRFNKRS